MLHSQFEEQHGNPPKFVARLCYLWQSGPDLNGCHSVKNFKKKNFYLPIPSQNKIWQLWIGRYTHIPAFRYYPKAASIGGMFSRLQYVWATSCFLASVTLLTSLVLLYVNKTLYHFNRLVTNGIGCVLVIHMLQITWVYITGCHCGVLSNACKLRLCVAPCKRVEQRKKSASRITRIATINAHQHQTLPTVHQALCCLASQFIFIISTTSSSVSTVRTNSVM